MYLPIGTYLINTFDIVIMYLYTFNINLKFFKVR